MEASSPNKTISAAHIERGILVATAIICALLEMIDVTIVNVALPEIRGAIGATRTEIAWVITSYAIANTIIIPLSGMLSNLFGRKIYFTGSVLLFTVCSLMCGMSTTLGSLVFWRFIQGIAGGGLLSTAQSIVVDAYPPEKINTANSIFGIGVILGPVLGPVLGGVIVQHLSWNWIFFVNLPVGAIAAFLSLLYVSDLEGNVKPKRIDWWGILFLSIFISSLTYVLEEGGIYDWFSSTIIIVLTILAILGLVAFVIRELTIDYAAVNLRLLKNRNLAIGNFMRLLGGAIMAGSMFIFPLFVRVSLGWTPLDTGVFLMYFAISASAGMILAKKILEAGVPPKVMMIGGLVALAVYLFKLSFSAPDTSSSAYIFPLILGGLGATAFILPVMSIALEGLRGVDLAQGTGIGNMLKQMGSAVGIAGLNIYLDHQNAHVGHAMAGYINDFNPISQERLQAFKQVFISAGYATDRALQAAYKMLGNIMHQQQVLVSYDHGYFMMGVCMLAIIPLIFLIKTTKKKTEAK
jgi:DHA2 family multidrug resistance protein